MSTTATWVFAQGRPHPPAEETGTNNLSVPAIFVPSAAGSPFTGTCTTGDDSVVPAGVKGIVVDGVLEHPDYYIQGDDTWQADCSNVAADNTLTVNAEWGDNLTSAPLKAGTPIRVEIGFLADPTAFSMPGYEVVKLDPTLLDRESHYGTLGNEVAAFGEVRVWNSGVTLDIRSSDSTVVDEDPFSAEINATGRVVYGFNWQNPVAGTYTITVTAPTISIDETDAGDVSADHHTVTLAVTVGNKGGGGGGKGGRPGGGGPGGG